MKQFISCKICGKNLRGKQVLFCSVSCKNKAHQSYLAQQDRGFRRKYELVKMLGGECSLCGYRKNLAALTFHHRDPSVKSFKLDMRSLSNRKITTINKELEKCILVCSNCHAELHYPQHNVAKYF